MAPITALGKTLLVGRDLLKKEINAMFNKLNEKDDLTLNYYLSFKGEITTMKDEWVQ